MGQEVKIGVQAHTDGAERNIGRVEDAAGDLAEALGGVSDAAKDAAKGVAAAGKSAEKIPAAPAGKLAESLDHVAKSAAEAEKRLARAAAAAERLRVVQSILSRELGQSVSPTDATMFLHNFEKMRGGAGLGSQRVRSFSSFENWYTGHTTSFKNPNDAARHRRMVMSIGMQGTPFIQQHGAPPGGGGGGGGGQPPGAGGGPSPFMSGVRRAQSSAMSFGAGMLGLAGITSVMGMAAHALELATEFGTSLDSLKRRLGDVGVGFDTLKDKVRESTAGLGITQVEAARLGNQLARTSGRGGTGNLVEDLQTSAGMARSFGFDPSEGAQFVGTMRRLGTADEQGMRRLATLIADGIEKGGFTAKADEVLRAVADFASQSARASLSTPNVAGYASGLASMTALGYPGLDPAGAAGILGRANAAMVRGGAMGEASMNLSYAALAQGYNPIVAQSLFAGGLFGTPDSVFGKNARGKFNGIAGKYFSDAHVATPTGNQTNLSRIMAMLSQQYGADMLPSAVMGQFGLSTPQEAMSLIEIGTNPKKLGQTQELLRKSGIDPDKMRNMSGLAGIAHIAGASNMRELYPDFDDMISRSDVTDKEREGLNGALGRGDFDSVRSQMVKILADRGQDPTKGSETRQSLVDLKDVLTDIGGKLIPAVNVIRDAVVKLAYGERGAPAEGTGGINETNEKPGSLLPPKNGPVYGPDGKILRYNHEAPKAPPSPVRSGMESDGAGNPAPPAPALAAPTPARKFGPRRETALSSSDATGLMQKMSETDRMLGLPPGTTARQLWQENGFKAAGVSRKGAMGMAQVMPATLAGIEKKLGRKLDPNNRDDAIIIHREVMGENMHKFGNVEDALRAYNAGWHKSRWNNPETNSYVNSIMTPLPAGDPLGRAERVQTAALNVGITGEVRLPVTQGGVQVGDAHISAVRLPKPHGTAGGTTDYLP